MIVTKGFTVIGPRSALLLSHRNIFGVISLEPQRVPKSPCKCVFKRDKIPFDALEQEHGNEFLRNFSPPPGNIVGRSFDAVKPECIIYFGFPLLFIVKLITRSFLTGIPVYEGRLKMNRVLKYLLLFCLISFRIAGSHHGSNHVVVFLKDNREHVRRQLMLDHGLRYVSEVLRIDLSNLVC